MHPSTLQSVLAHLRKLTDPSRTKELSDADLLERFRVHHEEAAFTLLVQRHGPMILAVCRRILHDAHEAEDAFQATFLVLVRNADAIRKRQSLAAWLHGVASRIAHKARMQSARRQARQSTAIAPVIGDDPCETLAAGELRAVLDEEIERLPAKYRTPLVLCYLSDKTHEQAAAELGWPKSTLTARLARARELLRQQLTRRGFTVSAGLLAALLTEQMANAAIPALLTLSAARLGVQALMGETLAATTTVALADTFVKGAAVMKWTAALTLLATLGFATAVGHRMAVPGAPSEGEEPAPKTKVAGAPHDAKAEIRKPRVDLQGDPLPDEALARMGSGRLRHPDYVRTLAFSADGKTLVSVGGNGGRIWDAATGKLRRRFDISSPWDLSFAFTREGILVASAGYEKRIVTLQVFDPVSGKVRRRMELPDQLTSATIMLSRDGKWLAYGHDKHVRLYDTTSGREVSRLPVGRGIVFAPDDKTVAICDFSDTVRIHDTASGECTRRLKHEGDSVSRLAISTDGRYLASILSKGEEQPGEISIWDLRTGKERHRFKSAGHLVLSAAFSPDGKYVAVGCQDTHLLLFDLATGKEVRRYPTDAFFGSIAFSPDGKRLAASSGEGTIRLWETATGRVLPASADPFLNTVHELRFSSDGRRLLGHAHIHLAWDPNSGRELRRLPHMKGRDWPSVLAPDESVFTTADYNGTIHLWDAKTAQEVRALKGHEKWLWCMAFSPDGHRLVSSSGDGTLRVWDVASGREIHKFTDPNRIMRLAISADGRWLASASDSRGPRGAYEVILWDLTTGREKTRLRMAQDNWAYQLAFSPNSRLLAAVSSGRRHNDSGEVQVWSLTGESKLRSLDDHKNWVGSVAFSPDNRMLATGGGSGELFLWELASGRRRHHFIGHESGIHSLAFSPNGRLLAASSCEVPVFVWDVAGILESKPRHLSNDELRRSWSDLANKDAAVAFQTIRRLVAVSKQTLPFLRQHLKPVPAPDRKHIRQLVETLDSADFPTRQKAAEELEKYADAASSFLRQIMTKEKPSLEVRRRLQQILEALENKPETLRAVRAVEVLEWLATPDAIGLLDELAKGAADARLTREAIAARARLRR